MTIEKKKAERFRWLLSKDTVLVLCAPHVKEKIASKFHPTGGGILSVIWYGITITSVWPKRRFDQSKHFKWNTSHQRTYYMCTCLIYISIRALNGTTTYICMYVSSVWQGSDGEDLTTWCVCFCWFYSSPCVSGIRCTTVFNRSHFLIFCQYYTSTEHTIREQPARFFLTALSFSFSTSITPVPVHTIRELSAISCCIPCQVILKQY